MNDFTKSIKSILNERISSPFYGTLIVSWLLWNWKISYVTFFIDSSKLKDNKIDYILANCNDFHHLVTFPLISTLIILTIVPFITNGAYWITLIFDQWRINKKNEVERRQLLSLEQSIQLRSEIQSQEEKFDKLLKSKNEEIAFLKQQLEVALANSKSGQQNFISEKDYQLEIKDFLNNDKILEYMDIVSGSIQGGYSLSDMPSDVMGYFIANDLIESKRAGGIYDFTAKGKLFLREFLKYKNNK